ncbi:hypothetical protein PCANC_26902 [Puccinia coronata f. sp. avenae]|uniref:Uncharacterized protein n=1 Tax=Puccinia coronata f. sp. avenae TaxID=200324 RepID=A0A2N5TN94_9BASI|nr:hypothetical protein PCANC_26902 [Puccinia coronata f. sp. avenae]
MSLEVFGAAWYLAVQELTFSMILGRASCIKSNTPAWYLAVQELTFSMILSRASCSESNTLPATLLLLYVACNGCKGISAAKWANTWFASKGSKQLKCGKVDSGLYKICHQIENVIGVKPQLYEFLFTIGADTEVYPDSLNQLVLTASNNGRLLVVSNLIIDEYAEINVDKRGQCCYPNTTNDRKAGEHQDAATIAPAAGVSTALLHLSSHQPARRHRHHKLICYTLLVAHADQARQDRWPRLLSACRTRATCHLGQGLKPCAADNSRSSRDPRNAFKAMLQPLRHFGSSIAPPRLFRLLQCHDRQLTQSKITLWKQQGIYSEFMSGFAPTPIRAPDFIPGWSECFPSSVPPAGDNPIDK